MPTQDELKTKMRQDLETADDRPKPRTIREILMDPAQQAEMARAIPNAMSPDRLARLATTAINDSPNLQRCSAQSLIAGVMQAGALGLEPNTPLGHCWLLPFENTKQGRFDVQFILGYKGIINLALRSPGIRDVQAREVYKDDLFEYEFGLDEKLKHVPTFEEQGLEDIVTFYGLVRYADGGHYWRLVKPHTIEEHRKRSKSPDSPAWKNDKLAMSLKTVIRILWPYMPVSAEAAAGLAADGSVPTNYSDIVTPDNNFIDVESSEDTDEPAQEPAVEEEIERCPECGEVDGAHQPDCSKAPAAETADKPKK